MSLQRQRGFYMLEVLVAFSILTLAISTILSLSGTGMRGAALAQKHQRALYIAESKLAYLQGLPTMNFYAEPAAGESEGGFTWKSDVRPYGDGSVETGDIGLYQINIVVSWNESGRKHHVELSSLRIDVVP